MQFLFIAAVTKKSRLQMLSLVSHFWECKKIMGVKVS